jgi:hypothetical protein
MPHGGDYHVAIGNAEYIAVKNCMDYWATQTPTAKGVFIQLSWASNEGNTAGCYDASCSNDLSLGVAGKIGFALWDDLLAYAASKGLKVIIGFDWFNLSYGGCGYDEGANIYGINAWVPRYLLSTSQCGGTDAIGATASFSGTT